MSFDTRHVSSYLFATLIIGVVSAYSGAAELPLTAVESQVLTNPHGERLFYPDVISEFSGFTSSGGDPSFCDDATPKSSFTQGSSVKFNIFWDDIVEETSPNEYKVALAIQFARLPTIFHRKTERFNFPALPPGTPVTFCLAVTATLAADAPLGTFPWGARVTKLEDGTKVQGVLNDITITEGPKQ